MPKLEGKSASEAIELELEDQLPVVESELLKKEEETGLEALNYSDFIRAVKRYTYKG